MGQRQGWLPLPNHPLHPIGIWPQPLRPVPPWRSPPWRGGALSDSELLHPPPPQCWWLADRAARRCLQCNLGCTRTGAVHGPRSTAIAASHSSVARSLPLARPESESSTLCLLKIQNLKCSSDLAAPGRRRRGEAALLSAAGGVREREAENVLRVSPAPAFKWSGALAQTDSRR